MSIYALLVTIEVAEEDVEDEDEVVDTIRVLLGDCMLDVKVDVVLKATAGVEVLALVLVLAAIVVFVVEVVDLEIVLELLLVFDADVDTNVDTFEVEDKTIVRVEDEL